MTGSMDPLTSATFFPPFACSVPPDGLPRGRRKAYLRHHDDRVSMDALSAQMFFPPYTYSVPLFGLPRGRRKAYLRDHDDPGLYGPPQC